MAAIAAPHVTSPVLSASSCCSRAPSRPVRRFRHHLLLTNNGLCLLPPHPSNGGAADCAMPVSCRIGGHFSSEHRPRAGARPFPSPVRCRRWRGEENGECVRGRRERPENGPGGGSTPEDMKAEPFHNSSHLTDQDTGDRPSPIRMYRSADEKGDVSDDGKVLGKKSRRLVAGGESSGKRGARKSKKTTNTVMRFRGEMRRETFPMTGKC
ncbi:uncharacterized protein [Aquarana catesbeiana]|uniref:uncharacterized protein isoform X2 n=1 Tax=Aquarana catesbeiana TaxID=8400 RepID=UPI003CCA403B